LKFAFTVIDDVMSNGDWNKKTAFYSSTKRKYMCLSS